VSVYPGWAAISSIKQGLSANEGLRQFRAAGGKVGRSAWLALRAEVGAALAKRPAEMAANLASIPAGTEVTRFSTVKATGVIQQVEVLYRVKGTDAIVNRPFSVKGAQMIARQDAINAALDAMNAAAQAGQYEEQVVLGAVYVGTYELVPGGPA
jgi:hypothetical protein